MRLVRHSHVIVSVATASLIVTACGGATVDETVGVEAVTEDAATEDAVTEGAATKDSATEEIATTTGITADDDLGFPIGPLEWTSISPTADEAWLTVPIDYSEPDGPMIELYVTRRPAAEPDARIGSLLVNPGGPGIAGSGLATNASSYYTPDLLSRFDIVGWDPRGTGNSELPIVCSPDLDRFYGEGSPSREGSDVSDDRIAQDQEFAEMCMDNNELMWPHVGTNNSARDMDVLRRALGEQTISYFGLSYGSTLGAVWATMFPDTVRAAVLDSAPDPHWESTTAANSDTPDDTASNPTGGYSDALNSFFEWCSADPDCAFRSNDGDLLATFSALMSEVDTNPIVVTPDRLPVNERVAQAAVISFLHSDQQWPDLAEALASLAEGDGSEILAKFDQAIGRRPDGTYSSEQSAHLVIACDDDPRPRSEATDGTGYSSRRCAYFPPSIDPRIPITGKDAGPIVVVGVTGDPTTPFASSRAMAEALEDGVLVIVNGYRHLGYGLNQCINAAVDDYLINLVVPVTGTECR